MAITAVVELVATCILGGLNMGLYVGPTLLTTIYSFILGPTGAYRDL